ITDLRDAGVLDGAAIDGTELANGIVIADFQPGWLARVFFILRCIANGSKLIDAIIFADPGWPLDNDMRANAAARADFHVGADDAERPDRNILGQMSSRINHGARINHAIPCTFSRSGARRTSIRLPPPGCQPLRRDRRISRCRAWWPGYWHETAPDRPAPPVRGTALCLCQRSNTVRWPAARCPG